MPKTYFCIEHNVPVDTKWQSFSNFTYNSLLETYDKPFNIWNIDRTGIPDLPKEQKVIGIRGEAASQTVPGEKPTNTTILAFVSVGGLSPP